MATITNIAIILTLAAVADWSFWLQMGFNVIFALGMFWLKRKTDEADGLRKAVEKRDDTIRTATREIVGIEMRKLEDQLTRIERRLEQGEARFTELNQHDHQAELQLARELHQLREYILTNCATNESVSGVIKQVAGLREDLIRIQSSKEAT